MRILALDISKNAPGWAWLENDQRIESGTLETPQEAIHESKFEYPYSVMVSAMTVASTCFNKVQELKPDVVVVEQINLGKNRNTQRILDWIHCFFTYLMNLHYGTLHKSSFKYLSTGTWRKIASVALSKEDKRQNAKLSRAKSKAKKAGEKLDKKALGIRGRVNKKHVAVRWANSQYGLSLKAKNNDEAEALALGWSAWKAVTENLNVFCDGTGI